MEVLSDCHTEKTGKCIKQSALNVERNVKFLSSLIRVDQFIAENAIVIKDHKGEDIKLTRKHLSKFLSLLFSLCARSERLICYSVYKDNRYCPHSRTREGLQ